MISSTPTIALTGGGAIPVLGFGTWQLTGKRGYDAVRVALEVGYRHLDTATIYGNQQQIGQAIRDSGVPREDIFITTKIPPDRAGHGQRTITESLHQLGTDYVDLWLIHWPPLGRSTPMWRELIGVHETGQARAIGVSNFSIAQIDDLVEATGVLPVLNQIPWSTRLFSASTLAEARARGVVVEGYSPFKGSDLRDPVLREVAAAHGVTPAQVVLRWHVQHDIVVIPKSATPDRIRSNANIWDFVLSDDEMARIDALARR